MSAKRYWKRPTTFSATTPSASSTAEDGDAVLRLLESALLDDMSWTERFAELAHSYANRKPELGHRFVRATEASS
jgi:hypothetical protein